MQFPFFLLSLFLLLATTIATNTPIPSAAATNSTWTRLPAAPLLHARHHAAPPLPAYYLCTTTPVSPHLSDVKSTMMSLLRAARCRYTLPTPNECMVMQRHKSAALGICADRPQAAVRCYEEVFVQLRRVLDVCARDGRVGVLLRFAAPDTAEAGFVDDVVVGVWASAKWKGE